MILAGSETECADCSSHPQAAQGTAVVALAVAIGALLWLVSSYVIANTPTAGRADNRES